MSNRAQRVKELFEAALDRPSAERAAYLDGACNGDAVLRDEVRELLKSFDAATAFLSDPEDPPQPGETAGALIGRYKLLEEIGEGGFGVVWMAEQVEPVRRKVALKVIKLGMDTRQVIARFEAERQALALMDHPNIAKVLDGGTTGSGRPYFVMELVRGIPITEYCDQASLSHRERLDLFQKVCQAIQHAHQKGLIHRDLKPSNILVTLHDGVAVPKVIDFGIAKATSHELTRKTLFTEFRQMIGTPEYMAPEQAEFSGLDVDTRADIYSLGVLLYELLTGTKPFEMQSLAERGYAEMMRHLREVDPPKPSTRVSTLGELLPAVAKHRKLDPARLGRAMRGDLDWICMKALEKDRKRRYGTAIALAEDIQRHLDDLPVEAGPPSAGYRFSRFIKRNRGLVLASAIVLVALLAGVVGTGLALARARVAEADERTARERAEENSKRAEAESRRAASVIRMTQVMLAAADPHQKRGHRYTVRQLLEDFDRGIVGELADEPGVEAAVRTIMGSAFRNLGMFKKAEDNLRFALDHLGPRPESDPATFGVAKLQWGWLQHDRGRYAEAAETMRASLAVAREHAAGSLDVPRRLVAVADCLTHLGNYDEAEQLANEAMSSAEQIAGRESLIVASVLDVLASVATHRADYKSAEKLQRQSVELRRGLLGPNNAQVATALQRLSGSLQHLGRQREAVRVGRRVIAIRRKVFGPDHTSVASALNSLAVTLVEQARYEEAEPYAREALAINKRKLGENKLPVAYNYANLAAIAAHIPGREKEAAEFFKAAGRIMRRLHIVAHRSYTSNLINYSRLLTRQEKYGDAEVILREALGLNRKVFRGDHHIVARNLTNLAQCLSAKGDHEKAVAMFGEALAMIDRMHDVPHPDKAATLRNLGDCHDRAGNHAQASSYHRQAVAMWRELDARPATLSKVLARLGLSLLAQKKYEAAEKALLEAREKADDKTAKKRARDLVTLFEAWNADGGDKRAELQRVQASLGETAVETGK